MGDSLGNREPGGWPAEALESDPIGILASTFISFMIDLGTSRKEPDSL